MAQTKRDRNEVGVSLEENTIGTSSPTKKARSGFFSPASDSTTLTEHPSASAPIRYSCPPIKIRGLQNDEESEEVMIELRGELEGWLHSLPLDIKESAAFKMAFQNDVAEYIRNACDAQAETFLCHIVKGERIEIQLQDDGQGFPNLGSQFVAYQPTTSTKKDVSFFGGQGKFLAMVNRAVHKWEGGQFQIRNIILNEAPSGAIIQISIPINAKKMEETPDPSLDEEIVLNLPSLSLEDEEPAVSPTP